MKKCSKFLSAWNWCPCYPKNAGMNSTRLCVPSFHHHFRSNVGQLPWNFIYRNFLSREMFWAINQICSSHRRKVVFYVWNLDYRSALEEGASEKYNKTGSSRATILPSFFDHCILTRSRRPPTVCGYIQNDVYEKKQASGSRTIWRSRFGAEPHLAPAIGRKTNLAQIGRKINLTQIWLGDQLGANFLCKYLHVR